MKDVKQFRELNKKELYDLEGGLTVVTGPYVLPQMIAAWMVSLFTK